LRDRRAPKSIAERYSDVLAEFVIDRIDAVLVPALGMQVVGLETRNQRNSRNASIWGTEVQADSSCAVGRLRHIEKFAAAIGGVNRREALDQP
jgi:hypothetical protein